MFVFGFDPGFVERARFDTLAYWHARAFAFSKRRQEALDAEAEIATAIRSLPRG